MNTYPIDEFVIESTKILELEKIINEPGALLYSSCKTLKQGKFYLIGLNPGGVDASTIKDSLQILPLYKDNAYLDEDWSSDKKKFAVGEAPLQKRVRYLFESVLNIDLREVCASNLIFVRSIDQNRCKFNEYAKKCWKVHELIIKIVQPKVLIVFGNGQKESPYRFLKKYTNSEDGEKSIESGHRKWEIRCFKARIEDKERLIIGLPHLSRYRINENQDRNKVVNWIRERVSEV